MRASGVCLLVCDSVGSSYDIIPVILYRHQVEQPLVKIQIKTMPHIWKHSTTKPYDKSGNENVPISGQLFTPKLLFHLNLEFSWRHSVGAILSTTHSWDAPDLLTSCPILDLTVGPSQSRDPSTPDWIRKCPLFLSTWPQIRVGEATLLEKHLLLSYVPLVCSISTNQTSC